MSGHSKWSTIKRAKGATDARRGQLFTKLTRDITLAVGEGGGPDPTANFRLRLAVEKAKGNNMPMDTIDRAIKRAAGGAGAQEQLESIYYEGYGPGGAAIMLQALTPNRNRTAAEVRAAFTRVGASLGEAGCVAWIFETKGIITMEVPQDRAEEVALFAMDAAAEDVQVEDGFVEVHTRPEDIEGVRRQLEEREVSITSAEISMVPKSTVGLAEKEAEQTLRLLDTLEELADVQRVYSNADFPPEVLERYGKEA